MLREVPRFWDTLISYLLSPTFWEAIAQHTNSLANQPISKISLHLECLVRASTTADHHRLLNSSWQGLQALPDCSRSPWIRWHATTSLAAHVSPVIYSFHAARMIKTGALTDHYVHTDKSRLHWEGHGSVRACITRATSSSAQRFPPFESLVSSGISSIHENTTRISRSHLSIYWSIMETR